MNSLKRILLMAILAFCSISQLCAQEPEVRVGSNHTFSLRTLYGIEYGYEYKWKSGMSLIGRIGGGSELYGYSRNYVIGHGFDLEIEPRYYLNDEDFFSVKVNGALLIPNTPFDISLVPVYGLRRDFSKHWFCEFTVGGGIAYYSGNGGCLHFKPNLQFRIGVQL